MPTDYAQIAQENIQRYGTDIDQYGPVLLANLYSDRTHFVYELLQNAEDAKATQIEFTLFKDRLEVRHDGRPFNESDVQGICGLVRGTKKDDFTQIGKFGIGFKSVYAYTNTPRVHSVDEAFCIEDYVHPHAVPPVNLAERETLFVFPFDHQDVPSHVAFAEIASRLGDLGLRTLLFLRHIDQICWSIQGGGEGDYIREATELAKHIRRVYILSKVKNHEEQEEEWLVFSRPLDHAELQTEVAFQIDVNSRKKEKPIIPTPNSTLVAFFPTYRETHLQFLIQGPYRTTPARDNIPGHDEWNKRLIQETKSLVSDAIVQIKEMGLLTVSFLEVLPTSSAEFPEGFMFRPIYDSVLELLRSEERLLPAADGGHTNVQRAVLARGRELIDLLDEEQLAILFAKPGGQWLDPGITLDRTPQLRDYLMNELEILEIDGERFARQFSAEFVEAQDDDWIARLYVFLSGRSALLRRPEYRTTWYKRELVRDAGLLGNKPVIRLSDNAHVAPFDGEGEPTAYLPGHFDSSFPTVKKTVLRNQQARQFLVSLGFTVLDTYEEVIDRILPKYEQSSSLPERREVLADNHKIARALETASKAKRTALIERLSTLPILYAHKHDEDAHLYSPNGDLYLSSKYTNNKELEDFLQLIGVIADALFVDHAYAKIYDTEVLTEMGCIGELDKPQEITRHVLHKYTGDDIDVTVDDNLRDVRVIAEVVAAISSEWSQQQFIRELQEYSFLKATNAQTSEKRWRHPRGVHLGMPYTGNEDIEVYFSGNRYIDFLDEMYIDCLSTEELELLGCQSEIRMSYKRPSTSGHVRIKSQWGEHERGLDGFDPDFEIQRLQHALERIEKSNSLELARIVWDLAKRYPQSIYGTVEFSTRQTFTGRTSKTEQPSHAGKLLRECAWLPDQSARFHIPCELSLSDLPDDFDKDSAAARELAVRLGCKPEIDTSQLSEDQKMRFEFAQTLNEAEIELIKDYRRKALADADEDEEGMGTDVHFAEELRKAFDHPQKAHIADRHFPPGPIQDPDLRRKRTEQEIRETMEIEPSAWERFRRVPERRWESKNYETRVFLEEQYSGQCQICGQTFIQRSGKPYFEGLYLVSRTKAAWIDRPGNILCLCANCCAKMLYGTIVAEQDVIEQLRELANPSQKGNGNVAIEFTLCGQQVSLTFAERHIIDLQEMLKAYELIGNARGTTDEVTESQEPLPQPTHPSSSIEEDPPEQLICLECGSTMSSTKNFCTSCGARLR